MTVRQLLDLAGRSALVTGGSRGLGLQIAEALGEMGAKIALTARKLGEPQVQWIYPLYQSTKQELAAALPAELVALTWSCRRPVREGGGFRPCGACKACLARQEI